MKLEETIKCQNAFKLSLSNIKRGSYNSEIQIKFLSNYLLMILKLHPNLNIKQFMVKKSKDQLLKKCFKHYQ